ncbi:unnamed protein product, partial [Brassica oleracea var. botrytis]
MIPHVRVKYISWNWSRGDHLKGYSDADAASSFRTGLLYIWIMVIMRKMVLRDYSRTIGNQIYKFDLGSSQRGLWNVRLNI